MTSLRTPALLGLLALLSGCGAKGKGDALAKTEFNDALKAPTVPAADGPKLVALHEGVEIFDKPGPGAAKFGEIGTGYALARSAEPVSRDGCKGGWYAVRPRGFVCAGPGVALGPNAPRLSSGRPNLANALPFRYGRTKFDRVPVYSRVPNAAEQLAAENDLKRHLFRPRGPDPLGAAANDVPLDTRFVATGPAVIQLKGEGVDGGRRTTASFFEFPSEAPIVMFPLYGDGKAMLGTLRRGTGLAVTGTFTAEQGAGAKPRKFAVTADGRVVPADRLKPALGSTWHGVDLEKDVSLPMAFVHRSNVHTFSFERGRIVKHTDELERRTAIPMSGKFRTVEGTKYEETKRGEWLRSADVVVVVRKTKFPEFAKGNQKWLDISLAYQTLTAYEGTKAVYVTLISSGRDGLKETPAAASTARGAFRLQKKFVTRAIDPREVQNGFELADVPWVMEFSPGYQLVGAYWSDNVGEATMFHDVALTPVDAHRLFAWSDPQVPEGWKGVYDTGGPTTMVNVRP